MVLDDVRETASPVVERTPVLHAEVLGHGDLDPGDVPAVEQRLDDAVRHAQVQNVEQGLLTEEMVDPVDVVRCEDRRQRPVQVSLARS